MTNPLKNFSIQTIVRNTSPDVLQQYLNAVGLSAIISLPPLPELSKQLSKKDYVEQVSEKLRHIHKQDYTTMNAFLQVYVLTRGQGRIQTEFLQRSKLYGTVKTEFLNDCKGPYDRAFLLVIFLPEYVERFYLVYVSEQQSKRYWNERDDYIPESPGPLTEEDVTLIKDEVKGFLQREHRGNFCNEQRFDFDDKDYVFLFADDEPVTDRAYEESGTIGDVHYIPVFQIAIAYELDRRLVSVCCENTTTRLNVHRAVAKGKFGLEKIPDYPQDAALYDLNTALKHLIDHHRMAFDLTSSTVVEDMYVTAVRFVVRDLGYVQFSLDKKPLQRGKESKQPDGIYVAISSFFKMDRVSKNEISIDDARPINMEWIAYCRDPYDDNRVVPQRFTISGKNTCNLDLDGIHAEIRSCLERNGIFKRKAPEGVGSVALDEVAMQ